MRNYTRIFYSALSLILFWACYDDKGNYDYSDLGDVTLKIKTSVTVMYGDSLGIVPEQTFFKGTSEDQYAWAWEIAAKTSNSVPEYKKIADTKVLCIRDFREEIGSYDLRLCAIHRTSGVKTMVYCNLVVDNGISKAYLLLTRQANGKYDIDAISYPEGNIRKNRYSIINNGETIADAERLFYVNSSFSYDERLYLTQTKGGQTISPIDLAYQAEASNWFFEAPADLYVSHLLKDIPARDQYFICNGGVYYMNNVNTPLKASLRSVLGQGEEYNITGVGTMHNSSGLGRYAFYDNVKGRFLEWKFGYGENFLGNFTVSDTKFFDPQAIGKRFVADISGKEDRLWLLFDDGADLWLYTFEDGAKVYYNLTFKPYEAPVKLDASLREIFLRTTAFGALKTADKFYFAVDNQIWLYDASTHRVESEPFYTSLDPDMRFVKIFYRDKVAQELTFAGNSNGKGYFFQAKVDYLGRIVAPTKEVPEPFKAYDGFGEIKDFVYKNKAY